MAIAAAQIAASRMPAFLDNLDADAANLVAARPTAVNLGWAVQTCLNLARACRSPVQARQRLLELAHAMMEEDIRTNHAIGRNGAELIPTSGGVLTHCNTGALATAGYGTALGVIRAAWENGKRPSVFCTETRPWLQGSRLTTWEFKHLGIPSTLVVDSAAAVLMAKGHVDAIIVGADRIAANGDVANKVGTYMLAVLAKQHSIPFYVAAPFTTVDLNTSCGDDILVEERPTEEVTQFAGHQVASTDIAVINPAFDVTPSGLITAIITDREVVRSPYENKLRPLATKKLGEAT